MFSCIMKFFLSVKQLKAMYDITCASPTVSMNMAHPVHWPLAYIKLLGATVSQYGAYDAFGTLLRGLASVLASGLNLCHQRSLVPKLA